jgi:hypothetical protein
MEPRLWTLSYYRWREDLDALLVAAKRRVVRAKWERGTFFGLGREISTNEDVR